MFGRNKQNSDVLTILQRYVDNLSKESASRFKRLGTVSEGLGEGWETGMRKGMNEIIFLNRGREALLRTMAPLRQESMVQPKRECLIYQTSSIWLRECWRDTTSDPSSYERLNLVTGTITEDGTRVLSRMERVSFKHQSPAYVCADLQDSHRKIVSLAEEHGHPLLAVFHSHISKGAASTTPSMTDIRNLERESRIGIECLGGIFSLDGYVRFFSLKEFEISVYGKGVEVVDVGPKHKVFRIMDTGGMK